MGAKRRPRPTPSPSPTRKLFITVLPKMSMCAAQTRPWSKKGVAVRQKLMMHGGGGGVCRGWGKAKLLLRMWAAAYQLVQSSKDPRSRKSRDPSTGSGQAPGHPVYSRKDPRSRKSRDPGHPNYLCDASFFE